MYKMYKNVFFLWLLPILVGNHVFWIQSNLVISNSGGKEIAFWSTILALAFNHCLQGFIDLILIDCSQFSSECLVLIGQLLWRVGSKALLRPLYLDNELSRCEHCLGHCYPGLQLVLTGLLPQTYQVVPDKSNQEVNEIKDAARWRWLLFIFFFIILSSWWKNNLGFICFSPSLHSQWGWWHVWLSENVTL